MNDIEYDTERLINACKYRLCSFEVVICKSESIPCVAAIDGGKCPTLIKYFKEKNIESEVET